MYAQADFFRTIYDNDAPSEGWSSIPTATLYRAIHRVVPCISTDEMRPHVNSMQVTATGATFSAVATDGHRLAVATEPAVCTPFETLISRSAARVLDAVLADPALGTVDVLLHEGRLLVRFGGATHAIPTVNAQFPPWPQIVPTKVGWSAVVARWSLRQAVLTAARIHPDGYRDAKVGIAIAGDVARVSLSGDALPFSIDCGPVYERSDMMRIPAQARYIVTALRCVGGDRVRIAREDAIGPIVFTPAVEEPGEESFTTIVMPVHE
jgi:DNA polymerase-3 subunit beta